MITLFACTSTILGDFLSSNGLTLGNVHVPTGYVPQPNHEIRETFKNNEFHGYIFVHWVD